MTGKLPSSSARADLAALTKAKIMKGVADVIASERGEITFRVLAEASGVPERTIYRYYPTKEAVLSEFWIWLNERLGMPPPPQSPQELLEQVPLLFAAFETDEPLVRAMLHDRSGRATRLAKNEVRQAKLKHALKDVLTPLEPMARTRLLAGIQVLLSAAGWEIMKDYCRLTSEQAADAARWAAEALLAQSQQPTRRTTRSSVKTSRSAATKSKES